MDQGWISSNQVAPEDRVGQILPGAEVEITSPYDPSYNCAAFALGITNRWLDSGMGCFWPKGTPRGTAIGHLVAMYESHGFEVCGVDTSLESRFEKIAIFEHQGEWQHVCKQCEDGRWLSKLGMSEDVKHNLDALESQPDYGQLVTVLRRAILPLLAG
jgi:hypothetical protein